MESSRRQQAQSDLGMNFEREDIEDSIQKFEKQKYEYSEKENKLYDEFIKTRDKDIKAQMDSMNKDQEEAIKKLIEQKKKEEKEQIQEFVDDGYLIFSKSQEK